MRKASIFLVVGLAAVSFVVAGCGKGKFAADSGAPKGNVFRYPIVTKPTSMDPGFVQDGDTIDIIQQVYEGLVGYGPENTIVPHIAEKWDVSADGTTYTFHLRKGVKFTNGRAVTAKDFKDCIERNCSPKVASPTARTYMSDIVGVTAMLDGKATSVSGVKVVDDATLEIKIDKPRPYFLGKLTYPCAFVFAKEALKDPMKEMSVVSEMVGSAGFKLDTVKVDQVVVMSANADYWDGKPLVDKIERPFIGDASTRLTSYKNGDIDLVQLERQDVVKLKDDPAFKADLKFYDRPSLWYIGLNVDMNPALKDVKVRRALAMALDRDKIVNEILGGINKRTDGIVPPGVFGYREGVKGIPFDPEGAKKLLAEAGFPEGKGFPEIPIYFRGNRPDIRIVVENAVTQWKNTLGVKFAPQELEWGAYLAKHNKKELPIFHMRWAADYLDAENFLSTLLASYGPENKVKYANPTYDALCRAADTSADEAVRKQKYAEAEDIVIQDAVFIPIYIQRDAELIRPRVQGMRESLFGHLPHTKVSLK